jgi:hypothetical protein
MKPQPTRALLRSTLRADILASWAPGWNWNELAYESITRSTSKLARVPAEKVTLEHLLWAYPMFEPHLDEYEPHEITFDGWGDDAFRFAGGVVDRVLVGVGRHAYLVAWSMAGLDFWMDDMEVGAILPARLANRIRMIKEFTLVNSGFTDERMHGLTGIPKAAAKELKKWERKALGPMPKGYATARRTAEELLDEPFDHNGEFE